EHQPAHQGCAAGDPSQHHVVLPVSIATEAFGAEDMTSDGRKCGIVGAIRGRKTAPATIQGSRLIELAVWFMLFLDALSSQAWRGRLRIRVKCLGFTNN